METKAQEDENKVNISLKDNADRGKKDELSFIDTNPITLTSTLVS